MENGLANTDVQDVILKNERKKGEQKQPCLPASRGEARRGYITESGVVVAQRKPKKEVKMDTELNKKMLSWVVGNDTGLSSQTIWAAIMGIETHSPSIPYDPADFGRCWRLLNLCDKETKEKAMQEVAKRHEIWMPFVEHWDELENLFVTGKNEELYTLLQEIRPF